MAQELLKKVKDAFKDAEMKGKYWALMLFNTEFEMGISNTPNKWINTGNAFYKDGLSALNAYSNTPNPASQLIDGETPEELAKNMEEMLAHYKDENWLEENLYPYL